jgi:hypothetical protein
MQVFRSRGRERHSEAGPAKAAVPVRKVDCRFPRLANLRGSARPAPERSGRDTGPCASYAVRRIAVDQVTYWHIELDQHDILLAEGLVRCGEAEVLVPIM